MSYTAAIDIGEIDIWIAGYEPEHTLLSAYQRVRSLARTGIA